jgi:hypothetical protein
MLKQETADRRGDVMELVVREAARILDARSRVWP